MSIMERAVALRSTAEIESQHCEETEQYRKDQRELGRLVVRLVFGFSVQWLRRRLMTIVDRITYSIFSGVTGAILFLVGFVLWNLSKVLSFYLP